MSHGGKRHGAGRRRNVPNKATAERQARIAATGPTPLDVMIDNMRFAHERAAQLLAKIMEAEPKEADGSPIDAFREMLRFREMAVECAKHAAPYVHPRLASVAHTGDEDKPTRIEVSWKD